MLMMIINELKCLKASAQYITHSTHCTPPYRNFTVLVRVYYTEGVFKRGQMFKNIKMERSTRKQ